MRLRRDLSCLLLGVLTLVSAPRDAHAQGPSPPALEEAKELFRQANELRRIGACDRAIELYLASRALVASVPNTLNAAICLVELGRLDEALEMYEILVATLSSELGAEDRGSVIREMDLLRAGLGTLALTSNVEGAAVVIDERPRGRLPRAPLRVLAGERRVRVLKDGYEVFEARVRIGPGEVGRLEARLEPILAGGKLRVDEPEGATIEVDGSVLGRVPWTGLLASGEHTVELIRADRGTGPLKVIVVAGQTTLLEPTLKPLGLPLQIDLEPPTASLRIDGVDLGRGGYRGRLPLGRHLLEAQEVGYVAARRELWVTATAGARESLRLEMDPDHPRWGEGARIPIWLEAHGGLVLAAGLGSDAEADCRTRPCREAAVALGALGGFRIGYELTSPLSIELVTGVLYLRKELTRRYRSIVVDPGGSDVSELRYVLEDDQRLFGPYVGGGVAVRQPLSSWLSLHSHLAVGAYFSQASDEIVGQATDGSRTLEAGVDGSGTPHDSLQLLVMPDLRLAVHRAGLFASLGLSAAFLVLEGPVYSEHRDIVVLGGACKDSDPAAVDCAPGKPFVRGERSHAPLVAFVPSLGVGYAF